MARYNETLIPSCMPVVLWSVLLYMFSFFSILSIRVFSYEFEVILLAFSWYLIFLKPEKKQPNQIMTTLYLTAVH